MVHQYLLTSQNTRLEVALHHRVHGHLEVVGLLDRAQVHQVTLRAQVVARRV